MFGKEACSEVLGFEHSILYGHLLILCVSKDENKFTRGQVWPIKIVATWAVALVKWLARLPLITAIQVRLPPK